MINHLQNGPVKNLTNIIESHGAIVLKTDLFTDKIDGLSTISEKGTRIIMLNRRKSNDRQRFSLAHELGHLVMHFDMHDYPEEIESEANRFASELLMPASQIRNSLRSLTFEKLGDLKRYWMVSMRSLVRRAHDLDLMNQRQYRNFQINFSRKGILRSEPIQISEEKPSILNQILSIYINELEYSLSDIARVVRLNNKEFVERFVEKKETKLKVIR